MFDLCELTAGRGGGKAGGELLGGPGGEGGESSSDSILWISIQ